MEISFIHSCASLIRWRGIWLPKECHSYTRRLLALQHFFCIHFLSTGQNSHYVKWWLTKSQCYVLIKQTDFPCLYQFWAENDYNNITKITIISYNKSISKFRLPKHTRSNRFLRANSNPKVTNPFCRLPVLTIINNTKGYSPWRPDTVLSTKTWQLKTTFFNHK